MPSFSGIRSVAAAMAFLERVRDTNANNMANADTHTFKLGRVTATLNPGTSSPIAIRTLDLSQGNLRPTGRPFDVALNGAGFLIVQTPEGQRLIRGGSFHADRTGLLVDDAGNPVMGENGPIAIAGREVTILEDGMVVVDGERIDRLRMVDAPADALEQVGSRAFRLRPGAGMNEGAPAQVKQGLLEEANVNAISGMVDMISTERTYGSVHSAMKVLDEVASTISNTLGRVK